MSGLFYDPTQSPIGSQIDERNGIEVCCPKPDDPKSNALIEAAVIVIYAVVATACLLALAMFGIVAPRIVSDAMRSISCPSAPEQSSLPQSPVRVFSPGRGPGLFSNRSNPLRTILEPAMTPLAQRRELLIFALRHIEGVSPLNPRADDREDIESLAASLLASGQLQPLLVVSHGSQGQLLIIDGQRRWRAMLLLVEQGHWTLEHEVIAESFEGAEADLREIALAANTMRRALHPVEEYEAFAAMARAGFDEERIARDFGLGLRHVRQRLALGRLSPRF